MNLLLFLLRFLIGTPDKVARLQTLRARVDGRIEGRRLSAVPSVWLNGIGWLTLPERFHRHADERARRDGSCRPWNDWDEGPERKAAS